MEYPERSEHPQYQARIRAVGRWGVLELTGELDIAAVAELERLLVRLVTLEKPVVVIDLREVAFFDCSILGALYRAHSRVLATGGRFEVLCVRAWPLKVMRAGGLLDVFRPVSSLRDLADLDALGDGPHKGAKT